MILGEGLTSRIDPPELAALLLANITIAAEQGITRTISEDSHSELHQHVDPKMLLTVVGNLIDDAIEALSEQSEPRQITVDILEADGLKIRVTDNGPGVPADQIDDVLVDGFSTKKAGLRTRRGLGLALVSRIVRRTGGTITVRPGPAAISRSSCQSRTRRRSDNQLPIGTCSMRSAGVYRDRGSLYAHARLPNGVTKLVGRWSVDDCSGHRVPAHSLPLVDSET